MKNSSKLSGVKDLRLEAFLDSNREFEFKKLIDQESFLVTYEIVKKFKSENRRLTIMKFKHHNVKEKYFFATLKDFNELQDSINRRPYNFKNGCKVYGQHVSTDKLIKWLDDPRNEILWFPENLAA